MQSAAPDVSSPDGRSAYREIMQARRRYALVVGHIAGNWEA